MTEFEFLDHHGLIQNPFADEDAQTDAVFKEHCINATYHPAWSKVYGDPTEPATAIVLGSKGAGKTAMRLQIAKQLQEHNLKNPERRVFFVLYDDFNAILGPLQERIAGRQQPPAERVLQSIRIWDHIDAILAITTTILVDRILQLKESSQNQKTMEIDPSVLTKLDAGQKRDLLLLAAAYDQSRLGSFASRWATLKKMLRYSNIAAWYPLLIGIVGTLASFGLSYGILSGKFATFKTVLTLALALIAASWLPYVYRYLRYMIWSRYLTRNVRIGRRDLQSLTRALLNIPSSDIAAQPLPMSRRSDDRYAMLEKLQMVLRTLGFEGLFVLIDRIDEPDLVNGRPERMKTLIWPILDNKLLKHPGLGVKLLLPADLQYYLDRESREFNERARLDKQNYIRNFDWTGEALHDLVTARMRACSKDRSKPTFPSELLSPTITQQRLLLAMQSLKTPRSLFRFWYRLIAEHCKQYRSEAPSFTVSSELFEATLAVFQSEQAMATAVV